MTNFGHDLFWDTVATDQEAKAHRELVVNAKLAASSYWPFLAAATSDSEFEHRLALAQPEIEARVAGITSQLSYLSKLPEVRNEVLSSLQQDWSDLNSLRRSEAARRVEALLRIEAKDGTVELPKQFVHIMASKAGDGGEGNEFYEVAHVASPSFTQTVHVANSQDDALSAARQFGLPQGLPIYFNGRYVEGHLRTRPHEYFDHQSGRWVLVQPKQAYIDPDDKRRYDRYPVGDAQVASGGSVLAPVPGPTAAGGQTTEVSTGPDGFPADMAVGEDRSTEAYQRASTPGQWVVTPGTEWREDTTPNAATGQVTPSRHGSRRQASEGVGPINAVPGPNPNYFSQGNAGLQGPPAFPEDPSAAIEPKPAGHVDDFYDSPDGGTSTGTQQGTFDGQGYSRNQATSVRRCMANCTHEATVTVPHQTFGSWDLCNGHFFRAVQLNPKTAAYALDDPRPLQWRKQATLAREADYKYVKQRGDKWVVTQKGSGKVLSTHDSQDEAEASFRAMMAQKHGSLESPPFGESAGERTAAREDFPGWGGSYWDWGARDANSGNPPRMRSARPRLADEDHAAYLDGYLTGYPGRHRVPEQHSEERPKDIADNDFLGGYVASARRWDYEMTPDGPEVTPRFESMVERGQCVCGADGHVDNDGYPTRPHPNCPQHGEHVREAKLQRHIAAMPPAEDVVTCPNCRGRGTTGEDEYEYPCTRCGGAGWYDRHDPDPGGYLRPHTSGRHDEDNADGSLYELGTEHGRHDYPRFTPATRHPEYLTGYGHGHDAANEDEMLRSTMVGRHSAAAEHIKDYRIVGHCDNCHAPVRWHGGASELRHLHNNDNRCDGSNTRVATAAMDGSVTDTNVPQDPGNAMSEGESSDANVPQQTQHTAVGIEQPTPENPTGRGSDEYRARNWDTIVRQRPMQSIEDRNINTPTLPTEPIKTLDTDGPRERNDMDEDDSNERTASLLSMPIADLMEI